MDFEFTFDITNSLVKVRCDANRYDPTMFSIVYIRALDVTRAQVNLMSFASGLATAVILHTFIAPDGAMNEISMIADPAVALHCKVFSLNPSPQSQARLAEVFNLVVSDPPLFMALDDLIVSIALPHHSIVNCGRALDGLRKIMETPNASIKQSWNTIRNNLNLSELYLKLISDTSTDPRHGDRTHVPPPIVSEVLARSWEVMNRFIEFRLRGNQPLPQTEFPLL